MITTSRKLQNIYKLLHDRFGHQHWWPGDSPLEICVGAILTQNTNWRNVEKAIANLQNADVMQIASLCRIPPEELAELVRPAGYFNVKTKRLKHFVMHVEASHGDDVEAFLDRPADILRCDLLSINGIGPETADSIILYAAGLPSFVIDSYTMRVLSRHGMIGDDDDYHTVKELFESSLACDVAMWNDFHAQFVAVGKEFCRPKPKCDGCPLEMLPHDIRG